MTRLEQLCRRRRELERELADVTAQIDAELDAPRPRKRPRKIPPVTDIAIARTRQLAAQKGIDLP